LTLRQGQMCWARPSSTRRCSRRWRERKRWPLTRPGERPGQRPAGRRAGRTGGTRPRRGKGGGGRPARANRPDPGRLADLAAGPGLAAQGRCRCGDPGHVHRAADDRRLHRLPAPPDPAGRHPAMLPAHHQAMPGSGQARPRRTAVLGQRHHRHLARGAPSRPGRPRPAAAPRSARTCWASSASATTRPPRSGSPTTGCGTGTRATTPAMRWAAGCASTKSRSSCSPGTSPRTGRPTSPSAARKPPSGTRPSPATGTRSPPSPAGAASEATSTPPPPTASPHSTPSATHSQENPGYHQCPPSADTNSQHPVNGHISQALVKAAGNYDSVESENSGLSNQVISGLSIQVTGR
jgi:hypothetical protein